MRIQYAIFISFACLTMTAAQVHAFVEMAQGAEAQQDAASSALQQEEQTSQANKGTADLEEKRKAQECIELENAFNKACLQRELAALTAEVERLMLEKETITLKWAIEKEKQQQTHEKEMLALNQQREKLRAEVAIAQAQVDNVIEKFRLASAELYNRVNLLKAEADQLRAEVDQLHAKKKRAAYADGEPVYLKEPLQKGGSLVISDRCIQLNGVITPWKANYVTDRIQYFNNKDSSHPIFIVIGDSPGGSAMAGWRILKAMQNSQAPVYVVVKSFAASMAACITTLADRSYAYPNAIVLHHQPWIFLFGGFNVREQQELYEELKKWWMRLGGPVAKKMGISIQALDKKFYEKSARGDWAEFADNAQKLKWVDYIISGITDTSMREMPDPANYTWEKYWDEYFGSTAKTAATDNTAVYLPPLGPKDFYFLYNPDNRYQIRSDN